MAITRWDEYLIHQTYDTIDAGEVEVDRIYLGCHNTDGTLITVADFAYEDAKIAIYCDGFAYHADKDKLASDAQKRNYVQSQGWAVLTFWGKTILKYPGRCEDQIWRVYAARRPTPEERKGSNGRSNETTQ